MFCHKQPAEIRGIKGNICLMCVRVSALNDSQCRLYVEYVTTWMRGGRSQTLVSLDFEQP